MHALDRDILFLLGDVGRLIRTRADQLARAHNMTRAQWVILVRVERQPGLSQSELAAICEVEPITIVRLVDRLEKHGFIERRRDPDDRRINRLYLTPGADPIMQEIAHFREQVVAEATVGLEDEVLAKLVDALLAIKSNLSGREPVAAPLRPVSASASAG